MRVEVSRDGTGTRPRAAAEGPLTGTPLPPSWMDRCSFRYRSYPVATGLLRIPLSVVLETLAVEEPSELARFGLSESMVSEGLDRMRLHLSACHGSTSSTPVYAKSFMLRVAQIPPCTRQIAAICASAVLIGAPAASRATSTSA